MKLTKNLFSLMGAIFVFFYFPVEKKMPRMEAEWFMNMP